MPAGDLLAVAAVPRNCCAAAIDNADGSWQLTVAKAAVAGGLILLAGIDSTSRCEASNKTLSASLAAGCGHCGNVVLLAALSVISVSIMGVAAAF